MTVTDGLLQLIQIAVIVEFAVLAALLARAGETRWIAPLAAFLASGLVLMMAVQAALGDAPGRLQAALAASGLLHGLTLWLVWRALRRR